jgi:hypothetical protein
LADRETGGIGTGFYCPECHERFVIPGPSGAVAINSLLIAAGVLAVVGDRSIIGFILGSVALWFPISLFLNAAEMRRKGVVLRKWKSRRRTFFEWMYERDSTPELFNKKER